MNIRAAVPCIALLLAAPLFAGENTDVVIMKNGDHLTCEIKGLDAGVLYISPDYILGTLSVDWSKVARLESKQLFIVRTEDGSVYTGTLNTGETPADRPVQIQVLEGPEKEETIESTKIVNMTQTSEKFWQRFNGAVNTGIIYSKGNSTTQYSLGSETEYLRERWSLEENFSSNLSASKGVTASTRNNLTLTGTHLLPWNNYFYSGIGSFLQSSELGIRLQSTLGGGIGRYIKHTNRVTFTVLGGFVWQNTGYTPSVVPISAQNLAAAAIATQLKVFKFNKTNLNLTAAFFPVVSEPGRVKLNTNLSYYIKLTGNLSWNISVYGDFDSQPPGNLPSSDYGSSSGLSWTFGLK